MRCRDDVELSQKAAEQFILLANEAAAKSGRFTVALSGGSTPKALYSLLATPQYSQRIPWNRVHLFWGDERCVPPDHAESNYRMVYESLLSKIKIPADNVHRMAGEQEPRLAAIEYEAVLTEFFNLSKPDLPRFDLIFLGLGEDGHTASLFPGSAALSETARLVAAVYIEKLKAHRLTLTLPALNQGAQITFLVAGKSKAEILKALLEGGATTQYPAALVQPRAGKLTWLVDEEAAANLTQRLHTAEKDS